VRACVCVLPDQTGRQGFFFTSDAWCSRSTLHYSKTQSDWACSHDWPVGKKSKQWSTVEVNVHTDNNFVHNNSQPGILLSENRTLGTSIEPLFFHIKTPEWTIMLIAWPHTTDTNRSCAQIIIQFLKKKKSLLVYRQCNPWLRVNW